MSNRRMSLVVLISLLALLWIGPARAPVDAQGENRVGLVVVHGDDTVVTRCISFSEVQLTGYEILQRSGLGIVSSDSVGQGLAVCALDGEGCAAEDCFCQCKGSTCIFWSYWQLRLQVWPGTSLQHVDAG